ncbi:MAG TPA: sulfotransferase, partial [Rhodospirillum rubrum]|nr:sulfotransferase [Rhodospirillum rubrum]
DVYKRQIDINAIGNEAGTASHVEFDELLGVDSSELFPEERMAVRPALNRAIAVETGPGLKLRKVHDRYWHTPSGDAVFPAPVSRGAVYLVRDPRDVALSFAHHRGSTLDEAIATLADPAAILSAPGNRHRRQLAQPLGDWSGHVLSWLDQPDIPVLPLRYEDLLTDPARGLRAVADHLGIAHAPRTIKAAIDATRFETLRAQEMARGFKERQVGSTAPFFRQGVAGGWRRDLAPAQAARILADHGPVMGRFGYDRETGGR